METRNEVQEKAKRIQEQKRQEYCKLIIAWEEFAEKAIIMRPEKEDNIYEMWDEIETIKNNDLLKERIQYAMDCVEFNIEWEEMEEEVELKTKEDYLLWMAGQ